MNEAIAIAQQILDAYGVTQSEPTGNFQDPFSLTPMKLENLQRREDFAPARVSLPMFGFETQRPVQICKKIMQIMEWFEKERKFVKIVNAMHVDE